MIRGRVVLPCFIAFERCRQVSMHFHSQEDPNLGLSLDLDSLVCWLCMYWDALKKMKMAMGCTLTWTAGVA